MTRPPRDASASRVEVSRNDVWAAVAAERRALVDDLHPLAPQRWATPSLCEGWDVHDVIAHLVDSAHTTRWAFVRRMVLARGDFHRDNATGVRRWRAADPRVTLAALADAIDLTHTPPAPLASRLVEVYVHSEDVRRPLGLPRAYPTPPVLAALDHQVRTTVAFGGGREVAQGLTLTPSDTLVSMGSGPRVAGRAIDLLLAVSGRPVAPSAFSGPGAAELADRLAP
ncbi:maleylpyruvate isomerase family mycothiol-dependent enzyme [Nocardioides sp. Y6]|uniref:Maleylpyruvate isomerase family mycothiol-dependent enzyme n=1 Tax=Nocardioides malaquae TaxID=2773426 RepID=A0ABR9RRC3_9ACTN|nr:maleylpyruvate isomerase family mycothiol-dependent enzyme [Nocardioides malaquae]MBE7324119.1 maleylpyruvate isomerase family mycothiol-dependent enzyme [Nocardioides malaquae]